MSSKLEAYIPMVEFLGKSLGQDYEVVLHDVTIPDHSIVAIANGNLSGRVVGGPANDFTLKMMKQGNEKEKKYVVQYRVRNVNGSFFRTACYFLRNDKGKLIGLLGINFNVTPFINLRNSLTKNIICDDRTDQDDGMGNGKNESTAAKFENFQGNIEEVIMSMIDNSLVKYSIAPDRLSASERIAVVEDLNESGLFLLKGGLAALADRLNVSEPTIYRYLSKVKRRTES